MKNNTPQILETSELNYQSGITALVVMGMLAFFAVVGIVVVMVLP